MLFITPNIALDENELQWQFIRAAGPGGQNVNKVATAAQLRFDVLHSRSLPEDVRQRFIALAGNRMTRRGEFIITAQRFRTQERNRHDAIDRLLKLIQQAWIKPKKRHKTKPTQASNQRRLQSKQHRAETKQKRQKFNWD